MTKTAFTLLGLFGFASVITVFTAGQRTRIRYVAKPASLVFLLGFYCALSENPSPGILGALICGLMGDIFFLFQRRKRFFLAGTGAFLGGHLFYAGYFAVPPGQTWFFSGMFLCVFIMIVCGTVLQLKLPRLTRSVRGATVIYMVVIGFMGLAVLSRWSLYRGRAFWAPLAGALLFMFSDTLISLRNLRKGRFAPHRMVSLTYYGAQFLLVWGASAGGITIPSG